MLLQPTWGLAVYGSYDRQPVYWDQCDPSPAGAQAAHFANRPTPWDGAPHLWSQGGAEVPPWNHGGANDRGPGDHLGGGSSPSFGGHEALGACAPYSGGCRGGRNGMVPPPVANLGESSGFGCGGRVSAIGGALPENDNARRRRQQQELQQALAAQIAERKARKQQEVQRQRAEEEQDVYASAPRPPIESKDQRWQQVAPAEQPLRHQGHASPEPWASEAALNGGGGSRAHTRASPAAGAGAVTDEKQARRQKLEEYQRELALQVEEDKRRKREEERKRLEQEAREDEKMRLALAEQQDSLGRQKDEHRQHRERVKDQVAGDMGRTRDREMRRTRRVASPGGPNVDFEAADGGEPRSELRKTRDKMRVSRSGRPRRPRTVGLDDGAQGSPSRARRSEEVVYHQNEVPNVSPAHRDLFQGGGISPSPLPWVQASALISGAGQMDYQPWPPTSPTPAAGLWQLPAPGSFGGCGKAGGAFGVGASIGSCVGVLEQQSSQMSQLAVEMQRQIDQLRRQRDEAREQALKMREDVTDVRARELKELRAHLLSIAASRAPSASEVASALLREPASAAMHRARLEQAMDRSLICESRFVSLNAEASASAGMLRSLVVAESRLCHADEASALLAASSNSTTDSRGHGLKESNRFVGMEAMPFGTVGGGELHVPRTAIPPSPHFGAATSDATVATGASSRRCGSSGGLGGVLGAAYTKSTESPLSSSLTQSGLSLEAGTASASGPKGFGNPGLLRAANTNRTDDPLTSSPTSSGSALLAAGTASASGTKGFADAGLLRAANTNRTDDPVTSSLARSGSALHAAGTASASGTKEFADAGLLHAANTKRTDDPLTRSPTHTGSALHAAGAASASGAKGFADAGLLAGTANASGAEGFGDAVAPGSGSGSAKPAGAPAPALVGTVGGVGRNCGAADEVDGRADAKAPPLRTPTPGSTTPMPTPLVSMGTSFKDFGVDLPAAQAEKFLSALNCVKGLDPGLKEGLFELLGGASTTSAGGAFPPSKLGRPPRSRRQSGVAEASDRVQTAPASTAVAGGGPCEASAGDRAAGASVTLDECSGPKERFIRISEARRSRSAAASRPSLISSESSPQSVQGLSQPPRREALLEADDALLKLVRQEGHVRLFRPASAPERGL